MFWFFGMPGATEKSFEQKAMKHCKKQVSREPRNAYASAFGGVGTHQQEGGKNSGADAPSKLVQVTPGPACIASNAIASAFGVRLKPRWGGA